MLINIDEIKFTDRIRKDFGDLKELAEDIKENGLINPPVVTPDNYELIAGERRIKAMKLLGYQQIEVRPMAVKDAEHALNLEISENETRKDFSKAERIDYARKLERIEKVKAKQRRESNLKQNSKKLDCLNSDTWGRTDEIIAKKLRIGGKDTYHKEKYIVENKSELSPEEFADWDEGKLSTNKAFIKIKKEKEQLEKKISELKSSSVKIIDNTDYSSIKELEQKIKELETDKEILTRKVKLNQEEADKFNRLKSDIEFLTQKKSNLSRQMDSSAELSGLTVRLQKLLENELAPIKFKRCMDVISCDEVCIENLSDIITKIDSWSEEMKKILLDKKIIINI